MLYEWSTTAANNASGVTSVNWAEGQAPSTVNDSARQTMADVRAGLANAPTDVVSATTTDIGAVNSNYVNVTGTTTITGLGTVSSGIWKFVKFAAALTFTHNATSLILPGAANIVTAAGDVAIMVSEGSGNWRCIAFLPSENALPSKIVTTAGDILYASAARTLARLALGSANQRLFTNAAAGAPEWAFGTFKGSTTHDISVTGSQAITGVGFKPRVIIAIASQSQRGSVGMAMTGSEHCIMNDDAAVVNSLNVGTTLLTFNVVSSANQATATVASYDADGFTLTWAKTGAPGGTATIGYICIR